MATKAAPALEKGRTASSLLQQVLFSWRVNNAINLELLDKIPGKGFAAVPLNSRGRTVARQFAHMHSVRIAWMQYFKAPEAQGIARFRREPALSRTRLKKAFRNSGEAVAACVERLLETGGRIYMFKGSPVLWLNYLIAHDSHHRGQIALALKQNGMRLPDEVALGVIWRRWHSGRDN